MVEGRIRDEIGWLGFSSNVRLYDKNKEIIAHKREEKLDLAKNCFGGDQSSKLSEPKAIGEMVQDIMRLDTDFYKRTYSSGAKKVIYNYLSTILNCCQLGFPNLKIR